MTYRVELEAIRDRVFVYVRDAIRDHPRFSEGNLRAEIYSITEISDLELVLGYTREDLLSRFAPE